MKLVLLYWESYIPDCPADLEITDSQLIMVVEDHPDVEMDVAAAKRRFMLSRLTDDLASGLDTEAAEMDAEEMVKGFGQYADGYFRTQEVKLNAINTGYIAAGIQEEYQKLPAWTKEAIAQSIARHDDTWYQRPTG